GLCRQKQRDHFLMIIRRHDNHQRPAVGAPRMTNRFFGPHASFQRTEPVRKVLLFVDPGDQPSTFACRISYSNLAVAVAAVTSLGDSLEHERTSIDSSPGAEVRNNCRPDLYALAACSGDPNDELPGIALRKILVRDAVDVLDS